MLISLLAFGYITGGWIGMFAMLVVAGVIGAAWPHKPTQGEQERMLKRVDERRWEKVERAKRGSEIDPTRPDDDDHPLMLTQEIRRLSR